MLTVEGEGGDASPKSAKFGGKKSGRGFAKSIRQLFNSRNNATNNSSNNNNAADINQLNKTGEGSVFRHYLLKSRASSDSGVVQYRGMYAF